MAGYTNQPLNYDLLPLALATARVSPLAKGRDRGRMSPPPPIPATSPPPQELEAAAATASLPPPPQLEEAATTTVKLTYLEFNGWV